MNFKKLILIVAMALSSLPALASTDCDSTVKWMMTDAGSGSGTTTVYLASGATFFIYASDANARALFTLVEMAMTTQSPITARFLASGLTCATATGRTDLTNFYNYGAGL